MRGEVYSSKLESSSQRRTYFFNLKVDRRGNHFIAIVESTPRPEGGYRRNQVLVYQEDLPAFQRDVAAIIAKAQDLSGESGEDDMPEEMPE